MKISALSFACALATACGASSSTEESTILLPTEQARAAMEQRLARAGFSSDYDIFHGRSRPPDLSSLSAAPHDALGVAFVRYVGDGEACGDPSVQGSFARLVHDHRLDDCRVITREPASLVARKVEGGAAAELSFVFGDAAANANYAFELFVTEFSATFERTSRCVDLQRLARTPLRERVCEVMVIVGAVTTAVSFRSYRRLESSAEAGFSVVNIGGSLYSSTNDIENRNFMTVDVVDVSPYFVRSEAGFLQPVADLTPQSSFPVELDASRIEEGQFRQRLAPREDLVDRFRRDTE